MAERLKGEGAGSDLGMVMHVSRDKWEMKTIRK